MTMTNQTYRNHLLQRRDLALRNAIDNLDLLIKECQNTRDQIVQAHSSHGRTGQLDSGPFWQTFRAAVVALNQIQMLDSIPGIKPAFRPIVAAEATVNTLRLKNGGGG